MIKLRKEFETLWCSEFATASRARHDVRVAGSGDNEELSQKNGASWFDT